MRLSIAFVTLVSALAAAATGIAGGFATVGFQPLPDSTAAGETWHPRIFVKQHGITPLAGLQPVITIEDAASGVTRRFTAVPTGETGVYEAEVVFPAAGDWRIEIDSGFNGSSVTYGPVAIGSGDGAADAQPFPVAGAAAVLGALAAAAGMLLVVRRLRRPVPAGR